MIINPEKALRYLGGNTVILKKLYESFLYSYKDFTVRIITMDEEERRISYHSLKGIAPNLGVDSLEENLPTDDLNDFIDYFSRLYNEIEEYVKEMSL